MRLGGAQILNVAARNGHTRMDDVTPRVNASPITVRLKGHPLSHRYSESVVDPPDPFAGYAACDDLFNDGMHRTQQLNLQSAAYGPGLSFTPTNLAVDVGETVPLPVIAKHFPGQLSARLGQNTVMKSHHAARSVQNWTVLRVSGEWEWSEIYALRGEIRDYGIRVSFTQYH
jgi:hypothetical protein